MATPPTVPFCGPCRSALCDVSCVHAWRDALCDLCVHDPCGGACDESRDGGDDLA